MTKTVTRLFDSHTQAIAAVEALENAGIDEDRISLLSNNTEEWHHGHKHPEAHNRHGDDNEAAEGAGKGATSGAVIGGGAGLFAGLGMLAIPGLGPVVAAGWLASTAVGALAGALAGGATGGLLGALKDSGHTDDEANVYSEGVRRGGTLVSVKAHSDEVDQIEQIFGSQNGVDATTRGQDYRQMGWTSFEPGAEPYSADDIARERESRSARVAEGAAVNRPF